MRGDERGRGGPPARRARGSSAAARGPRRRASRASSRRSTGPTGCCPSAERAPVRPAVGVRRRVRPRRRRTACAAIPETTEDDTLDLLTAAGRQVDGDRRPARRPSRLPAAGDAAPVRRGNALRRRRRGWTSRGIATPATSCDLAERAGRRAARTRRGWHWVERLCPRYDDLRVAVRVGRSPATTRISRCGWWSAARTSPTGASGTSSADWSEARAAAARRPARTRWRRRVRGRRPRRLVPGRLPACDPARPGRPASPMGGRHVALRQTRRRARGHRRLRGTHRGGDRPLRAPGRTRPRRQPTRPG